VRYTGMNNSKLSHSCKVSTTSVAMQYHACVSSKSGQPAVLQIQHRQSSSDNSQSVIHSFIHSLTHSLVRSFIHSFVRSFVHSFIHSFIHSLCLWKNLCTMYTQLVPGQPWYCQFMHITNNWTTTLHRCRALTTFLGGALPTRGLGVSWSFMVAKWRSSRSRVACTLAG